MNPIAVYFILGLISTIVAYLILKNNPDPDIKNNSKVANFLGVLLFIPIWPLVLLVLSLQYGEE